MVLLSDELFFSPCWESKVLFGALFGAVGVLFGILFARFIWDSLPAAIAFFVATVAKGPPPMLSFSASTLT